MARDSKRPRAEGFSRWPRSRPIRWFRTGSQLAILFPLFWLGYGIEVRGRSRLDKIRQPCLIISNHNMHLDWSMVLRALPRRIRSRTAIAAASTDVFGSRRRALATSVLGNAFPFDKEGSGIRESLEHITGLVDTGWNVYLLPEGKLTVLGPMQPFKSGIGWLVARTGVEVVPIRIDVLRPGIYEGKWFPRPRGRVRVSIGEAVKVEPGTSYEAAVRALEEAVRTA